jgi:transposase
MAKKYTDEFRCDAMRMATTSDLTRPQLSSDLGVGVSTLNKWVQQHQHDDLMSGPHEDVERENERLRKEVRLLREEREVLKKPFRVGARLCAVETACAMLRYEGQRPFAYWWSVLGQNPVKKRGPWGDANLRMVTLIWL